MFLVCSHLGNGRVELVGDFEIVIGLFELDPYLQQKHREGRRHVLLDHLHNDPRSRRGVSERALHGEIRGRGRSERAWFLLGALFFPLFPIPWMTLGLLPRK